MRSFLLLCLLALSVSVSAQSYVIKGSVQDTVNFNPLHNASITLLRAEDSVLESFTRTGEDGTFSLTVSEKGSYILMTVFPGFADFIDKVDVQKETTDVGQISMTSRAHLLEEFVYTDQFAAIKIKGDTVEYVADSFKVKDNAAVEELLKKLPGLQVDKDGNIQAHGQKVEKLLVDGEEFFTDDPAVVSKSLQAKAVDKVQVFDKKSDQAEFTGIDDGEVTRTVNLQLKDNMKTGYFGKVVAAGGAGDLQSYYENQGMFNYFKGKKKIAVFGIMANTGKIGLGWRDQEKYGMNNNESWYEDGMYYSTSSNDEFESWNGEYDGRGYPKAWTGGAHYSDKWNEDKHHLAANYRYAKQNIASVENTFTQLILPDSVRYTDEAQDEFKSGERHKINGLYEWKTDSLSTLKITATADYTNSINRSDYNMATLEENGDTTLTNDRMVTNEGIRKRLSSSLSWRKKFKKDRRTMILSLSEQYEESESEGFLKSSNLLKQTNTLTNLVDQKKNNADKMLQLSGSAIYTEPITKTMAVSLEYRLSVNNSETKRETFNKSTTNADVYNDFDSTFSNNYAYNIVTHSGGTTLSWDYKKLDFSAGVSAATTDFTQRDLLVDTSFSYDVVNLFPKANFRFKINKQTSLRFSYRGNTQQPTIRQIQPLQDNTNPNNIAIGNADLTQEFTNRFNLNFNDYKMLSGRYIYVYGGFSLVDNAITRSENIDNFGRRAYRYVNVDGNYNGYGGGGIGKRINKINGRIGANFNLSVNRTNNFVNGVQNTSDFNRYAVSLDLDVETKNEKLEIGIKPGFSYNDNKATISTQATSYWQMDHELNVEYELPWKLEIETNITWSIREQTAVFDRNNNVMLWNAHISKSFFENDQLELKLSAFDILNQNLGFRRFASSNQITETNFNTIRRYGLVSLIWNFTKMGKKPDNSAADFINNN